MLSAKAKVCAAVTPEEDSKKALWSSVVTAHDFQAGTLVVTLVTPIAVSDVSNTSKWMWFHGGGPCGVWKFSHADSTGHILTCTPPSSKDQTDGAAWELAALVDGENLTMRLASPPPLSTAGPTPIVCSILPPLVAYCRTTIFNVFEIDTVRQAFSADVFFEVRFRGIAAKNFPESAVAALFETLHVNADVIECLNTISIDGEVQKWTSYGPSSRQPEAFMDYTFKLRFKACFSELLELQEFPFDQQSLHVSLTINQPTSLVTFRANDTYPSLFLVNNFAASNVFDVITAEHVLADVGVSDPSESSSGYRYHCVDFQVVLQRKPGFYISNVMVPVSLLTYLGFLSFGIESTRTRMVTSARLAISVTLLLTTVAYKFATAGALPQISYMTSLDRYVTFTSLSMCLLAVENAVFPWVCSGGVDSCFDDEQTLMWTLFGLFTAGIGVAAILALRVMRCRHAANRVLLEQHHLRLLVARHHPAKSTKTRDAMYAALLERMQLPPVALVRQKQAKTHQPGLDATREAQGKAHLDAIAAAGS
ncbi:Aste57867_8224 [Aphanomyces stellatus]|uniref:Aste57867_8224 protein n=1 Tax=Aphanomyces stellatus TaxID=120398 RepID=A0A485KJU6_9STRA|nr:hypothetical protein As57867_008193 [Aphanomyces stellatus]VFT85111.1 Aste57867_8224 [Aphanomyces stellatus]